MVQLHSRFVSIHQPVDELSEGLIWASGEGCLEDVIFLLSTGVEVNSRGQVRLRVPMSGGMSNGAMFSPYFHCYTVSPGIILGLPHPPSTPVAEYPGTPELHRQSWDYPETSQPPSTPVAKYLGMPVLYTPAIPGYTATGMLGVGESQDNSGTASVILTFRDTRLQGCWGDE